jgi:hypothetical protein
MIAARKAKPRSMSDEPEENAGIPPGASADTVRTSLRLAWINN